MRKISATQIALSTKPEIATYTFLTAMYSRGSESSQRTVTDGSVCLLTDEG